MMILQRGFVIEYYETYVNSTHSQYKVPKVFQVKGITKKNGLNIKPTRHNIFKRDDYTCAYCGIQFNHKDLTLEHIIPKCQGGNNSWKNLISACSTCNNKKGARTPIQANMPLLFKPKIPGWSPKLALKLKNKELKLFEEYILY